MQTYKIEVDEAVWAFLKKNAKDAGETPNAILKRMLSIPEKQEAGSQTSQPKHGEDWSCS